MLNNLEKALVEALRDEYKARATYRSIIEKFGPIRPFTNIIQSEQRHIQALLRLFRKYNFPIPIDDWQDKVIAPDSILEACQQGVIAEKENEIMYNRLLEQTRAYPDVQRVFLNLKRASLENHLRAFSRYAEETPLFSQSKGHRHCHGKHHLLPKPCRN